jgi:hypothetical protein
MARVEELLELLKIDKTTMQSIVTCLHFSQAKASLLQTQTRLLHDALERKNLRQHSKLVIVQNPIFKDDEEDEVDSDQQPAQ